MGCCSVRYIESNTLVKQQFDHCYKSASKRIQLDTAKFPLKRSVVSRSPMNNFTCNDLSTTTTEWSCHQTGSSTNSSAASTLKTFDKNPIREQSSKSSMTSRVSISVPQVNVNTSDKLSMDESSSCSRPSRSRTFSGSSSCSFAYVPVSMTTILDNLYIGSWEDAINEVELKANGITHILSLIGNRSPVDFVQHEIVPMHDGGRTNLKKVLTKIYKFVSVGLQDANSVLVHCQSGQNRSATVVIALLMMYKKKNLYRAHKKVKSLRPIVQINQRYAKQLLALEKEIFGKNSLPHEWMERGGIDIVTGDITYKYEHINSEQLRTMLDFDEF